MQSHTGKHILTRRVPYYIRLLQSAWAACPEKIKYLTHIFDNRLKRKYGKWSEINSHTGANGTRRANTNNTNQTYRYNVHSCCLITKEVNKIWLNCDFNYITIAAVQLRFWKLQTPHIIIYTYHYTYRVIHQVWNHRLFSSIIQFFKIWFFGIF